MLKRMTAVVLTLALLLLFGGSALAAGAGNPEYRIATTNVNIRSGPSSEKYPVTGSLVKGQLVKYLGKDGNWSKISYNNITGYVFSKYLSDPLDKPVRYYRAATTNVNVRSGPNSAQYPAVGALKKGEKVQYLGDSGSWAMVLYKGDIGFVYAKYLGQATTDGSGAEFPGQYRVATTNVNVRTGPSSEKYPTVGALKKGEIVQYLGTEGNWSKISYKDGVAYVFSKYLADPASQPAQAYRTATTNVNVRSGPSSEKYPAIGALKKGEKVQYLGVSGNWAMVLYGGRTGFVYAKYLTAAASDGTPAPSPQEFRMATANVNVRTGPSSAKFSVMGALKKGEVVQFAGISGNWTMINFKGETGYVFSQYLAKVK